MDSLQLKLCDIQGRLFELFVDTEYDPESLVEAFMNGEIAKNLDSEYNRMQWAGEEYLLEELIATCKGKLVDKRKNIDKNVCFGWGMFIAIGIFIQRKIAIKYISKRRLKG